jgi:hypothetical protein
MKNKTPKCVWRNNEENILGTSQKTGVGGGRPHHSQRSQSVHGERARIVLRIFQHTHFLQTVAIGGHDQRHDLAGSGNKVRNDTN